MSQVKEVALIDPDRRTLPVIADTSLTPFQPRLVEPLGLKRFQAIVGHTSPNP
jgi:hypothetical protein